MKNGKVWLAGAGPGDPGLLTVKAKRLIETADVIVYDRLVGDAVLSLIPCGTERIDVGKTSGHHPVPQEEISRILLKEAQKGKKVLRLKGGDPFVFGRGGEEIELLSSHQIPYEIIPGITSAVAVPAYAGIPVTHRDFCSSFHIITAHRKRGDHSLPDFDTLAKLDGTLIFLMGVSALEDICKGLILAGMKAETPAAIIESGTTSRQRRVVAALDTLPARAKEKSVSSPAVIVVGRVCSLENQLAWAEHRPLHGCRIVVTRPKNRASSLAERLEILGAEVLLLPSIQTKSISPNPVFLETIQNLDHYQWIAFTSPAGAELFFEGLHRAGKDSRCLSAHKIAAIGPATAKAVLQYGGLFCDYQPEAFTGESLGNGLSERLLPSDRLLLPRSDIATDQVLKPLIRKGISYTDLPVYETKYQPFFPPVLTPDDIIAFTSASTVRGFVSRMKGCEGMTALCIGEQTAEEAKRFQFETVVAKQATIDSMIEALICYHQERKKKR